MNTVKVAVRVTVTYNVAVMVRHRVQASYRDSMGGVLPTTSHPTFYSRPGMRPGPIAIISHCQPRDWDTHE